VKQKLKVAIVNVVTCLFLAVVLESAIYAGLENPSIVPGFARWVIRDYYREKDRSIIQVTDCALYDSELFYLLKPGTCRFENREFATTYEINSAGLRDDESSLTHPRVIALGDSYTMGWGVQQDESFPQLLEKELGWRVLNAGVSSYGTAREISLLKRLRLDSARVIILQYHGNDFGENQTYLKNGNSLPIRSKLSYDSLRRAIESRQEYFFLKHLIGATKVFGKKMLGSTGERVSETTEAQTFLDVLRQADIDPAIKILVFKVDEQKSINNKFAQQVDSLLKTPPYQTLNVQSVKMAGVFNENDFYALDEHMNKNGHAKIAAEIKSRILSVSQ
jgi:lysophospholipase L1-like esterase